MSYVAWPPNECGGLIVRGLCKSFLAGVTGCNARARVLRNVDLEVRPGEIVGICGAVGSGKTTLLLCMAGLLKPDAGSIVIGGGPPGRLTNYVAPAPPNDRRLTPSQRLAGALSLGAPVLLLDGVLAGLPPGAGALLGQLASRGTTIVAAEREWSCLEPMVERVLVLHEGGITAGEGEAARERRPLAGSRVAEPNGRRAYP